MYTAMTASEFKAACKTLGLTYAQAAERLGKAVPTLKMYATGKRQIPEEVEVALERLLQEEAATVVGPSIPLNDDDSHASPSPLTDRILKLEAENASLKQERTTLKETVDSLRGRIGELEKKLQSVSQPGPLPRTASIPGPMSQIRRGPPASSLKGKM